MQNLRAARIVDVSCFGRDRAAGAARIARASGADAAQITGCHEACQPAARNLRPAVAFEQNGHARARAKRTNASVIRAGAFADIDLAAVSGDNRRRRRRFVDQ